MSSLVKERFRKAYLLYDIDLFQANTICESITKEIKGAVVDFKTTADGIVATVEACDQLALEELSRLLEGTYRQWIVRCGQGKLEQVFYECLRDLNLRVTTAESVTGGMIASRIINVPGASKIIREAFIVYSKEAKINNLNVPASVIAEHGEVSEEVAGEMARNAQLRTGADIVVSTTGYAGPKAGNEQLGLVCFGFAIGNDTTTSSRIFSGSRSHIRKRATAFALAHVIHELTIKGDK